jgi:hypothetical protein
MGKDARKTAGIFATTTDRREQQREAQRQEAERLREVNGWRARATREDHQR